MHKLFNLNAPNYMVNDTFFHTIHLKLTYSTTIIVNILQLAIVA